MDGCMAFDMYKYKIHNIHFISRTTVVWQFPYQSFPIMIAVYQEIPMEIIMNTGLQQLSLPCLNNFLLDFL
jgi:hypothetical protein